MNSEFKTVHLRSRLQIQLGGSFILFPHHRSYLSKGERVRKRVERYDQRVERYDQLLEKKKKHRGLFSYGETHQEPTNYQETLQNGDSVKWKEAMEDEFSSLKKNQTWTLTELPAGKNVVDCKRIYKIKYKPNGSVDRYKARLVAKGYSQDYGV